MARRVTPEDHELRAMSESTLKAAVLGIAYQNGWIAFHLTHDPRGRNTAKGSGYPDLTLARDGEALWIELKRETEELEPAQRVWMVALPAMHVVRPSDLVNGRIVELLG